MKDLIKHNFIEFPQSQIKVFGIAYVQDFEKIGKFSPSHKLVALEFIKATNTNTPSKIILSKPSRPQFSTSKNQIINLFLDCTEKVFSSIQAKVFNLNEFEEMLCEKLIESYELLNPQQKRLDSSLYNSSAQTLKSISELLLLAILKKCITEGYKSIKSDSEDSPQYEIVKKIIKILNEKIYTTVNLDYISKKLFFSKTYIKYIFKKYKNTSIIQYFNNLKIEEAKNLISTERYSFKEISKKLSFTSVQYFNRLFKSVTGITPSDYQKENKSR